METKTLTPKYRKELAQSFAGNIEKTASLDEAEAASFLQLVGQIIQMKEA